MKKYAVFAIFSWKCMKKYATFIKKKYELEENLSKKYAYVTVIALVNWFKGRLAENKDFSCLRTFINIEMIAWNYTWKEGLVFELHQIQISYPCLQTQRVGHIISQW